jgi:methylmalonyl-CoA carboxyltransferase large subunit
MKSDATNRVPVADALEALRQEVARLGERVAVLEAALGRSQESGVRSQKLGPGPQTPDGVPADGLSEELLVVISAAVAAFLGKKPHIRQIRLLGSGAWAQQGRVTIQASHALSAHHH